MKKQLKAAVLCISALLTTPLLANNLNLLQIDYVGHYELPSNEPQVFVNFTRWTAYVECVIEQSDVTSAISFKVLRKKGTINDITLSKGETLRIDVHPKEAFHVIAIPGASVEMLNEGDESIMAQCTVSPEQ
ncbi:MAG: hypothetical protein QNK11_03150 [Legionella sp.]|nr:hypothetical protein [Legionella sp.]